jgi:hypothetical protein
MVDFSLENMRKVMILRERELRAQSKLPVPDVAGDISKPVEDGTASAAAGSKAPSGGKKRAARDSEPDEDFSFNLKGTEKDGKFSLASPSKKVKFSGVGEKKGSKKKIRRS